MGVAAPEKARISYGEPMARHTSWRVGGPADIYFRPRSRDELVDFLRRLDPATAVHWVGLGSNLLVRDGGIRGVVIATAGCLEHLRHLGDGLVEAEAGVPCTVLARHCARWQVGPASFFAGIPGTVGGALVMNAGAFGGETWQQVVEVEVVNRRGEVTRRSPEDYRIAYREVRGPEGEWFLAARFRFDPARPTSLEAVRTLIQERQAKQPLGMPSCGSVFRNPPGDFAGRLIEAAGLKGARIGGAQVSEKHANFIINAGKASAADIEALIGHVQARVAAVHGVSLVPEVHVLGEAADRESRE
ncbi:MAG: UDP-N-acetylenolpyruvoylglucosamine reductase [Gammaproteobacteria bacterium]|nr:MAG: UDP-N-acetylmuramate dehydrogenase [Pseudomonadota bacterium]MBC6944713.1 UDP-N-acetylmuramate dehydrogenase [Gammaproteobacteria bacterium]MCE7896725.1 UDP-N-acetylmuramate dehydrogenase [Gammaproteobacteria bacterium PRO8]MDL1881186.1 UDP-N-acetylmuramate dehydrogenase [Gammaproteobacteria bacterium PRO2]MCL4778030.1 UDP-N-acetylmuramate dehydrogenase [Gammaproteobacteria bacterium]